MDTAFYAARTRSMTHPGHETHLQAIEDENARLKRLLAEALAENAALKQAPEVLVSSKQGRCLELAAADRALLAAE